MAVPEVTIYNLLLKPQAFSFECLYLKKTTGNLSIYVPQKCPQKVGRETPFTVAVRRHGQKIFRNKVFSSLFVVAHLLYKWLFDATSIK